MKKMMLVLICMAACGTVLADAAKNFERADTDKDGLVSKAEFMAMRASWDEKKGNPVDTEKNEKIFLKKDVDENGELTLEEFSAE